MDNKDNLLPDISSYHDESLSLSSAEEKDRVELINIHSIRFPLFANMSYSTIFNNTPTTSILKDNTIMGRIIPISTEPDIPPTREVTKKIIFQPHYPTYSKYSQLHKIGIAKCDMVTSYFIGNEIFSQFSNPSLIESDNRLKCIYLLRENNGKFLLKDTFSLSKKSTEMFDDQKLRSFINSMNDFFEEEEYTQIISMFGIKKIVFLLLSIVFFVLIIFQIVFGIHQIFKDQQEETSIAEFWIFLTMYVLIFCGLCYLVYRMAFGFLNNKLARTFELIRHHYKHYNRIQVLIEEWNKILFRPCNIHASCPLTLDYVQFNLDPTQELEVKSHNLNEIV